MVAAGVRGHSGAHRGLSLLFLTHQDDAGPGVFAQVAGDFEEASLASARPPSRPVGDYAAAIVFGGDANVDEEDAHPWLREEKALIDELIALRVPLLGVCLGAQLVAEVAGARVGPLAEGAEVGWHDVTATGAPDPLFDGLPRAFKAFQWHGYGFALPPDATELARGARGVQAFRLARAPAWGIQFHAEVDAPTVAGWIRDYGADADIDQSRLAAESERELPRWNELGRTLCARFLATASPTPAPPARPGAGPR